MPNHKLANRISLEFGTPAVVVDLDVVERNIARVQALCDKHGVANRPHIKTHKSLMIASLQREAGASGITCQKLGEAEIMAAGGFDDILITYNLLGSEKMGRLGALRRNIDIAVTADNPVVVSQLPDAARIAGRDLSVLVECDTGRKRAGVETPAEAIALALDIASRPGLRFAGLMFYAPEDGLAATTRFHDEVAAALKSHGIGIERVSTGGTPNLLSLGTIASATEHRAGTCVFNDRMMMAAGFAKLEDCAAMIYTTVVSRAAHDRGILDAGSKIFTSDTGRALDGYGHFLDHPEARLANFAEEHGFLDLSRCNDRPAIGDVVRVVPNHICVVVNVVGEMILVRSDEIIGRHTIDARAQSI